MPSGLSLNASSGALSGSQAPGNYSFSVQVSDSQKPAATANLAATLKVLGLDYFQRAARRFDHGGILNIVCRNAGGTGTYTFSSPNLPSGLSLSGAALSGTPSTVCAQALRWWGPIVSLSMCRMAAA